jgi:hypothetical protein
MAEAQRRTRRARRVSIEAFDAMRAQGSDRVAVAEEDAVLPEMASDDEVPDLESNAADLQVPFEAQFGGKDFLPAPGLRRVALGLIMRDQSLRHLTDQRVEYLYKRRGGQARGVPKVGDCVLPSGLSKHAWNAMARAATGSASETVRYVIWLAADHTQNWTPLQVEAGLYRQLCKTGVNPRDHSEFRLKAPDFTGFVREIQRYGLWCAPLVEAGPAFVRAQAEVPGQQELFADSQVTFGSWETTQTGGAPETTLSNGASHDDSDF